MRRAHPPASQMTSRGQPPRKPSPLPDDPDPDPDPARPPTRCAGARAQSPTIAWTSQDTTPPWLTLRCRSNSDRGPRSARQGGSRIPKEPKARRNPGDLAIVAKQANLGSSAATEWQTDGRSVRGRTTKQTQDPQDSWDSEIVAQQANPGSNWPPMFRSCSANPRPRPSTAYRRKGGRVGTRLAPSPAVGAPDGAARAGSGATGKPNPCTPKYACRRPSGRSGRGGRARP